MAMRKTTSGLLLLAGVLFTVLNVMLRLQAKRPVDATLAKPGDVVHAAFVQQAPTDCVVVVAFEAECPYCKQARERERQRADAFATWLTYHDAPGNARFDRVVVDSAAFSTQLKVKGTPISFAIERASGKIKQISLYDGLHEPTCHG